MSYEDVQEPQRVKPYDPEFELRHRNLADLIDVFVDPLTNLIGNRWLTKDGSLFVVAPSGHGKSSFCIQCMILWALGRTAFGLKPSRPLRILMVESEDDDADNKAFVQVIRTMHLNQKDMDLLEQNTRIEFRRDLAGPRFFEAIDAFLRQYKADILIINPLTGFCGIDLRDENGMNDFLRNKLNAVMAKHGCAPMIVAHMPKGEVSKITDKEWYEWMYVLSGCVTLTNWARAILVFIPCPTARGTYRFITAKRPAQAGWVEPECYFAHSKKNILIGREDFEIIQWVPASEDQIKTAAPEPKEKKVRVTTDMIYSKMPPFTEYNRDSFRIWCQDTFKIGINLSDSFLKSMVFNGQIESHKGEGKGAAKVTTFTKNIQTP